MTIAHIDEPRLEADAAYRFGYLCEFVGLGPDDINAIHAAAAHLAPLVPSLVDAVYDKLFSYVSTERHFVPRQSGYDGPVPEGIDGLMLDHPMIAFRKQHLGRYLVKLVTGGHEGHARPRQPVLGPGFDSCQAPRKCRPTKQRGRPPAGR